MVRIAPLATCPDALPDRFREAIVCGERAVNSLTAKKLGRKTQFANDWTFNPGRVMDLEILTYEEGMYGLDGWSDAEKMLGEN